MASGKLVLARKKGEKIPFGWAVDKEGRPTEDPYEGYEGGGALLPVGAHKGYGMALVHEILTAVLTGGKQTSRIKSIYEEDPTGVQGTCHSFMAMTDCFIGKERFKADMDSYIERIKESAKAKDIEEILMPGEPRDEDRGGKAQEGHPGGGGHAERA